MSIPLAIRITSRKTKEERVFSSMQQGNEFLGRSKGYLQNRIREQNTMTGENYDGEVFDVEILGAGKRRDLLEGQTPKNSPGIYIPTMCWQCAKAYGFCRWSRELKPVEGWEAQETHINNTDSGCDSYFVKNCPEFLQDGKTTEERKEQRRMLEKELEYEIRKGKTGGNPGAAASAAAGQGSGIRAAAQAMAEAIARASDQRECALC